MVRGTQSRARHERMMAAMLFVQIGGAIPSSPWELVRSSTPVTQAVLVVLAILSLISWAVIFGVWIQLSSANNRAAKFAQEFDRAKRLEDINSLSRRSSVNALSRLYLTAAHFMGETRAASLRAREASTGDASAVPSATLTGSQVEALHFLLDAEADTERERLGRHIPWLATIGSVSPLLGLLGTVIGVITAFLGIATKGSGNLTAVAPGVAEALMATAASLAVAIPATFGYNILASRLNRFDGAMERFNAAVIARFAREGQI